MRSFKELNKLTGSDQKDLLYSVTGHAGGLDYKMYEIKPHGPAKALPQLTADSSPYSERLYCSRPMAAHFRLSLRWRT